MLGGRVSRREPQAEKEGRASVNNESIDPPADDGSGCYGDRCSVTRSTQKMLLSQKRTIKAGNGFFFLYFFFLVKHGDAGNK